MTKSSVSNVELAEQLSTGLRELYRLAMQLENRLDMLETRQRKEDEQRVKEFFRAGAAPKSKLEEDASKARTFNFWGV